MAADKSLIQGAAALAQADSAMGSALTKGAAAGTAPVVKQLFLNIEKENKLENEMVKRAEDINMKIMTNPNLAGEYHDDIKNAATTTRTEILDIAKDKSLSRSERNRLITEKVDGFNSLTSKYLVGQKVEADFVKGIEKGNYSKEDPELNENANEISKYFAGEEGKTVERNETGYVFKNFKDGEDLVVNYNQLDNYIPKVKDESSLKSLNTDLNAEARKFEIEDAGAVSQRLVQNFGEDQQRNLAANKYGINVKGMPPEEVEKQLTTAIQEDFKGRVAEKVDTVKDAERKRQAQISQFKKLFSDIDRITFGASAGEKALGLEGNIAKLNNLPSNYSIFEETVTDRDTGVVSPTGRYTIRNNSGGADIMVTKNIKLQDLKNKLKGSYRQKSIDLGDDFGFFGNNLP